MEKQEYIPIMPVARVKTEPLFEESMCLNSENIMSNISKRNDQRIGTTLEQNVAMKTEYIQSAANETLRLEVKPANSSSEENESHWTRVKNPARKIYKKRQKAVGADDISHRQCEHCQKVYDTKAKMIAHRSKVCRASKSHICNICQRGFKSRGNLHLHQAIHSDEKNFFCELCGNSYKLDKGLKNHIKLSHTTEPHKYRCHLCNYTSNQKPSLERHIRTHTGEKIFHCDLCGKSLCEKKALIQHIYLHMGKIFKPKPKYTCDMCGKQLSSVTALRTHVLTVHENREFPCDICGKILTTTNGYQIHMEGHGSETFQCSVCRKEFGRRGALDKHTRMHFMSKEECPVCYKMVANEIELRRHLKMHTAIDNQEHQCHICQYCFGVKDKLERHLNFAHREFTCLMCTAVFNDRDKLKRHKDRYHVSNCIECEYTCNDTRRLEHHVDVYHACHTCDMCGKTFCGRYVLNSHLYTVHKMCKIGGNFTDVD